MCIGHEHGGGGSLAADITNTEVELPVTNHVVEQVTTHLTGWQQCSVNLHVVEDLVAERHHTLLNLAGQAQLGSDAILF